MDFLLKKFWPSWQEQIDIKNTNTCESWNRLEGVFSSTCRPELHVKKTADCTFTVDGRYFSASPLKASESHPHELCSAPSSSPPPRPVTLCEDWQQHSSVGGVKSSSVPCVILNWSQVHYDSEGIRFPQHFLFDVFSTGATAIRAGADDEGDEDSGALQDSSVRVQLLACHFFTLTLLQQRHGSRSAPTWKLHFFPWRLRVFKWGRKNENVSGNKPKFTNMYLNVTKKQVMLKHLAGKDFY